MTWVDEEQKRKHEENYGVCPVTKNEKGDFVIKNEYKHPTEIKFPIQTKAFREIIEKMYQVHLDKNLDYSPANILVTGDVGVIVRTWDKIARIFNLSGLEFPSVKAEVEELIHDIETNSTKVEDTRMILERLDAIVKKSSLDFTKIKKKEAANESLDDSWLDLAVYAIIGYLERQNKWGK